VSTLREPLFPSDAGPRTETTELNDGRFYEDRRSRLGAGLILAAFFVIGIASSSASGFVSGKAKIATSIISGFAGSGFLCGLIWFVPLKIILSSCCQLRRHNEMSHLVETLFAHYVFSPEVIERFTAERAVELRRPESVIESVKTTMASNDFVELVNGMVDGFLRSAQGAALEAQGFSRQILAPFLLKQIEREVTENCVKFVESVLESEAVSGAAISNAVLEYFLRQSEEMDGGVIAETIRGIVAGWETRVVYAGIIAGLCLAVVLVILVLTAGDSSR
jgi:hypothetical protein